VRWEMLGNSVRLKVGEDRLQEHTSCKWQGLRGRQRREEMGPKIRQFGEARRKEGEGNRTGGRSEGTLGVISFGFSYCCCVRGRGRRRARAGVGGFGVSVICFLIFYHIFFIFTIFVGHSLNALYRAIF